MADIATIRAEHRCPTDSRLSDFAIQRLLEDHAAGRAGTVDADRLLARLRIAGDVHRLEQVSRSLRSVR